MNIQPVPERMTITDMTPNPLEVLDEFAADTASSGLLYGFAHGSMFYKTEGSLTGTYKEIRVLDPSTNAVISAEFEPKFQPPDIDIVAVVNDRQQFSNYFEEYARSNLLVARLNHFFTLNVVEPEILMDEIITQEPRAIKRILAYRPAFDFGQVEDLSAVRAMAKQNCIQADEAFQEEFTARKAFLEARVLAGAQPFALSAAEYAKVFPNFFAHLHDDRGGFPAERDKIVLPRSMDLKGKRYLGSLAAEELR